jgi:hypothetical protein
MCVVCEWGSMLYLTAVNGGIWLFLPKIPFPILLR